jgi:hypothetical protein
MKDYIDKWGFYEELKSIKHDTQISFAAVENKLLKKEPVKFDYMANWIPIRIKEITSEDKKLLGFDYDDSSTYMWDCEMPDDGEEVLLQTSEGIFMTEYSQEYGFEDFMGDELKAWMHKPDEYMDNKADRKA